MFTTLALFKSMQNTRGRVGENRAMMDGAILRDVAFGVIFGVIAILAHSGSFPRGVCIAFGGLSVVEFAAVTSWKCILYYVDKQSSIKNSSR